MAARSSSLPLSAGVVALFALAGCEKAEPAAAAPAEVVAPAKPDPAAPAPGTQAAEAIGVDSSSDSVVIPPEKQRR